MIIVAVHHLPLGIGNGVIKQRNKMFRILESLLDEKNVGKQFFKFKKKSSVIVMHFCRRHCLHFLASKDRPM